jgi:hypothetical protein
MPKLKTHSEFMIDLERKNKSYQKGEFEVVGVYKNKDSKILLKNKYGYCVAIANNLLKNYTLNIRSALHPNEYVKEMFREVHGYRYDYSLIDYQTAKNKLKIICHKHGIFYKNSNKHLVGEGCPKCIAKHILHKNRINPTGWSHTNWVTASKTSKSFDCFKVYCVRLYNEKEEFIKVGRSYTTLKNRMKHIPYKYEVLTAHCMDSLDSIRVESLLKKRLKEYKYKPLIAFDGMHECYNIKSKNQLLVFGDDYTLSGLI